MPGKGALDPRKVGVLTWDEVDNLRPTQDHVLFRLVQNDNEERRTASGLVLPSSARKESKLWEAIVLAVGPGACEDVNGERLEMPLKPGDRILVKQNAGWEIGQNRMVRVGAVEAVIE